MCESHHGLARSETKTHSSHPVMAASSEVIGMKVTPEKVGELRGALKMLTSSEGTLSAGMRKHPKKRSGFDVNSLRQLATIVGPEGLPEDSDEVLSLKGNIGARVRAVLSGAGMPAGEIEEMLPSLLRNKN